MKINKYLDGPSLVKIIMLLNHLNIIMQIVSIKGTTQTWTALINAMIKLTELNNAEFT